MACLRRGLATNLHDLGVDDITIALILGHSNARTTRKWYIKTLPKQSIAAMDRLQSQLCAECAPEPVELVN